MELEGSKYLRATRINLALTFAICLLAIILVLGWGAGSTLFVVFLGLVTAAMFFYAASFLYKCDGLDLSLKESFSLFLKGVPYRTLTPLVNDKKEGERRSAETLAKINDLDLAEQETIKLLVKQGEYDKATQTIRHYHEVHRQREAQDRRAIDTLIAEAEAACCGQLVAPLAESGRAFEAEGVIRRCRGLLTAARQQGVEDRVRVMILALRSQDYEAIQRVIDDAKNAAARRNEVVALRNRQEALPVDRAGHLVDSIDELAEITDQSAFRKKSHGIGRALSEIEESCRTKTRRRHSAPQQT